MNWSVYCGAGKQLEFIWKYILKHRFLSTCLERILNSMSTVYFYNAIKSLIITVEWLKIFIPICLSHFHISRLKFLERTGKYFRKFFNLWVFFLKGSFVTSANCIKWSVWDECGLSISGAHVNCNNSFGNIWKTVFLDDYEYFKGYWVDLI